MRSLRSLHSFSIVAPAIALLCAPPLIGLAQDDLTLAPYSVFVAEEEAFAYCGPSEDYYRTDPLRYGQTLDVYAETEDGWLGIRPPEDSFCWIPADTVELDESQEEGIISEDRTVAWIGTHLGRARKYRWQVQLAKGEPVTIIGRSEREGPDGPQLWYRIVPPSGEYRWIHRDSVVMTSEELVESVRHRESEKEKPKMARSEPASRDSVTDSAREADIRQTAHVDDDSRRSEASGRDTDFSESVASSGPSVLDRDEAIGSGLNEDWRRDRASRNSEYAVQASAEAPQSALDAFKQGGLLASLEFMTRPQIQEIGGQPQTAPASNIALDSNWVAGASRTAGGQAADVRSDPSNAVRQASSIAGVGNPIMQASAQMPLGSPQAITDSRNAVTSANPAFQVVPAERISQIEAEVSNADVDRLNLILSRLMASQASSAETEPVERAANTLASQSADSVTAGRARMLAEKAQRYRRVATRRDGHTVIQSSATIPGATTNAAVLGVSTTTGNTFESSHAGPTGTGPAFFTPAANASLPSGTDHGNGVIEHAGYLVQVYSARSNSPPFALTDHAGRTVAYVTPAPGVNLRSHLNSRISVVGTRGYLTGLNTPHIMATQAVRTPE